MNAAITGSTRDEEAFLFAMELASACALPMVLKSAIELDLLELIKKAGPGAFVSAAELEAQIQTTNPEARSMLDRILRLLASHSVLECNLKTLSDGSVERVYGLAPVCKFLTENEDGMSMAPFLLLSHDKVLLESWQHLKEAVVEGGIPFQKAHGMEGFDYFGTHPTLSKLFSSAMSGLSTIVMKEIAKTYKGFQGLNSIVDVGGGTGSSINIIVSQHPSIKGINFDLPYVVRNAPPYPGVEHIGGDMFVSVPEADAIFMKTVSHNWTDELCLKLFRNCYRALPEKGGKLILAESILPETADNGLPTRNVFHLDVIMLAHNSGGKERTEKEYRALAMAAGFKGFNKVCCAYNTWIMELLK